MESRTYVLNNTDVGSNYNSTPPSPKNSQRIRYCPCGINGVETKLYRQSSNIKCDQSTTHIFRSSLPSSFTIAGEPTNSPPKTKNKNGGSYEQSQGVRGGEDRQHGETRSRTHRPIRENLQPRLRYFHKRCRHLQPLQPLHPHLRDLVHS